MVVFLAAFLIVAAPPDAPFAVDAQTLLLVHFDHSLAADDARGEPLPSGAAGLGEGRFGQAAGFRRGLALGADGVRLPFEAPAYPAADNLNPDRGTLEFWFRPAFSEPLDEHGRYLHYLLDARRGTAEGIVLLLIRGADGQRTFQFWEKQGEEPESGLTVDVADWQPGVWRHIALTWDGPSRALWFDGQRVAEHEGGPERLSVVSDVLRFGSVPWDAHYADGWFDELRISDGVRYGE